MVGSPVVSRGGPSDGGAVLGGDGGDGRSGMQAFVADEMLQLLRLLVKRTDDLESQLQQQTARTMRDHKAVLVALQEQSQAVNAVSSRLGATTGQVSYTANTLHLRCICAASALHLRCVCASRTLHLCCELHCIYSVSAKSTSPSCAPSSRAITWAPAQHRPEANPRPNGALKGEKKPSPPSGVPRSSHASAAGGR